MSDCMTFPDTVEEFMEQYKVVDTDGVYMSKGSELVPIFRMKQWFEHLPSAQSEQRWILCSERLPEKDGEYLVESTRGYEVLYYREEEKQFGLMVFNFAGEVGFVPKKVYEWMPIPGVEE